MKFMDPVVFDRPEYMSINKAREEWLAATLACLPFRAKLHSALDLGCGAGYFSNILQQSGFRVTGLDLRRNNVELCRQRYPECTFGSIDLDDTSQLMPDKIGRFDLVLMFGLLYHLQSPLQVISRLAPCIGRVAIIESRVASGNAMACYLHQEFAGDDQNSVSVVSVPTLPALITMFVSSGLPYIYLPDFQPRHEQWDAARFQNGLRHQLIVSREPIAVERLSRAPARPPIFKWQPITD